MSKKEWTKNDWDTFERRLAVFLAAWYATPRDTKEWTQELRSRSELAASYVRAQWQQGNL